MSDLNKKLIEDIRKTGYPTELKVSKIFELNNWSVKENEYFIDEDENKGREIDLRAHSNQYIDDLYYICFWSMLSVEIKKSSKPWVIFTSNKRRTDTGGYGLLNHMHNINKDILRYEDIMKKHPSSKQESIGRTEYVAFTKNDPQIFSAVLSSTKASIANHRAAREHKEAYNETSYDAVFYSPVVVIEGKLYESYLNNCNEIEVKEVNHLVYSFNYASPSYQSRQYLVDIVTLDGLEDYLTLQRAWINHMLRISNDNIQKM